MEVQALDAESGDVIATPEPIIVPARNTQVMETLVSVKRAESKVEALFGGRYTLNLDFTDESEDTGESSTDGATAEESIGESKKPEKETVPTIK